jgi:hypothetical protein
MTVHVGDLGTAETPLSPQGFVQVNGERYDARAEHGAVAPAAAVVVVGGDHMGLLVRLAAGADSPPDPDQGRPIVTSFTDRVAETDAREQSERKRRLAEHRRAGMATGAVAGALAGAMASLLLWDFIEERTGAPVAVLVAGILGGGVYGAAVFRLLDDLLSEIDESFRRATTASTCLAVFGSGGAVAVGAPGLGLGVVVAAAILSAAILAFIPPLAVLLLGLGDE